MEESEVFKNIKVTLINHETTKYIFYSKDVYDMPIENVIERIISLNNGLREFWSNSIGWAPLEAAQLLKKSRLDWQVSLSYCLNLWVKNLPEKSNDGCLILGWVNLGSLVEGSLKLFVSVYYDTYKKNIDAIKKDNPDLLSLEPLRIFFKENIWDKDFDSYIQYIQQKRNSIHAFKNREIGTKDNLLKNIRIYLKLLRYINIRLPYPDKIYIPIEC